ncbi:MAG: aminotransferase class III, partial [Actinomycetota bacterium]
MLTSDPPRFDEADVVRIAREVFGFDGEVERRFESERDQNFLLSNGAATRRILKISNSGEQTDVLDMEVGAALHARRVDPSLPIAEPYPTVADPAVFIGTAPDERRGTTHMVRMFEHLPGRGSTDGMALDHEALWAYGETLARLGRALRGYFHPAADRVLLWN